MSIEVGVLHTISDSCVFSVNFLLASGHVAAWQVFGECQSRARCSPQYQGGRRRDAKVLATRDCAAMRST